MCSETREILKTQWSELYPEDADTYEEDVDDRVKEFMDCEDWVSGKMKIGDSSWWPTHVQSGKDSLNRLLLAVEKRENVEAHCLSQSSLVREFMAKRMEDSGMIKCSELMRTGSETMDLVHSEFETRFRSHSEE